MSHAPAIARNPEALTTFGDLLTLIPGAERGRFGCEGGPGPDGQGTRAAGACGYDMKKMAITKVSLDQEYVGRCPKCKRLIMFSPAWLLTKTIVAHLLKRNGEVPAIGTLPKDKGYPAGTINEEPLPDGRKRIIATPFPATVAGRSPC